MWYVENKETNPFLNLALEAYLLRERTEDFFYLWKNTSSVVCGKHQNIWEEVNVDFCKENNILMARRLSGGGTVYHDIQNLNFTFILNKEREDRLIDFRSCMDPIRNTLIELGVPAEFSARNDLFVNGHKVSGNAEHVDIRRKRILHHGTLLFQADLNRLRGAIRPELTFQSRSVKSVRSPVCNISEYLPSGITIDSFERHIRESVVQALNINQFWHPQEADLAAVADLSYTQYATDDWVFAYSPRFQFEREMSGYRSFAEVHQGKFVQTQIVPEIEEANKFLELLVGEKYGSSHVKKLLTLQSINPELSGLLLTLFV